MSDAELVGRLLAARDKPARETSFRALVQAHADAVYRICLSVTRDRQSEEDAEQPETPAPESEHDTE